MAIRSGLQHALALLLVVAPLAGCVGLEDLGAAEADPAMPLAASDDVQVDVEAAPLTVPATRLGESATFETRTDGYRVEHDNHDHEDWDVVPYTHNASTTRSVSAATENDAWLRPVAGVAYEHAFKDLDPDGHGAHGWTSRTVYEIATGLSVVSEFQYSYSTHVVHCTSTSCTEDSFSEQATSKAFARDRQDVTWGELGGRELNLGDALHFEKTLSYGEEDYLLSVDYTVLREEWLGDERAFVLKSVTNFERIGDDGILVDEELEPSHAEVDPVEVPEPVNLVWYTATASVPVRQYSEHSFEEGGNVYTTKASTELVSYEAGEEPIHWGEGDAVVPITNVPEDRSIGAKDYVAQTAWGSYPMRDAWARVNGDLLLRDYNAWKSRNPDARVVAAGFLPEPDEDRRTWFFDVRDEPHDRITVASRMAHPTPLPIATYENRDDAFPFDLFSFDGPVAEDVRLLDLQHAAAIHRLVDADAPDEPAAIVRLSPNAFLWEDNQATAVFGQARPSGGGTTVGGDIYFGMLEDPVTIDLVDGGLRSINGDMAWFLVYWSQLPTFAGLGFDALDATDGPIGLDAADFGLAAT